MPAACLSLIHICSVADFLQAHADFAPEDFALPGLGASRGGMLRIWPHRARGDGQFAALLRRAGGAGDAGAVSYTHLDVYKRQKEADLLTLFRVQLHTDLAAGDRPQPPAPFLEQTRACVGITMP